MTYRHLVEYGAQSIGLIPLAWLSLRREKASGWWLLASAFAVSWVADTVAHQWDAVALLSLVYPVGQAALVGMALLEQRKAALWIAALTVIGVNAVVVWESGKPDVLLHTVAWGWIVGMVMRRWELGPLRVALLLYFGLGLVAYYALVVFRSDLAWYVYQSTRLIGVGAFCYAVTQPQPALRLT